MDHCLLEQLKEKLSGSKLELSGVSRSILALTKDITVQTEEETRISRGIFQACLFIRRLLSTPPPVAPAVSTAAPAPTVPTIKKGGVRLPKVEVPKFDRNIMNWKMFWEEYSVSIDLKSRLSDPEKLAYPYQALKERSGREL